MQTLVSQATIGRKVGKISDSPPPGVLVNAFGRCGPVEGFIKSFGTTRRVDDLGRVGEFIPPKLAEIKTCEGLAHKLSFYGRHIREGRPNLAAAGETFLRNEGPPGPALG